MIDVPDLLYDTPSFTFHPHTIFYMTHHQLNRIEVVHSRKLIYRDIKPENFLIGRLGQKNQVGEGGVIFYT